MSEEEKLAAAIAEGDARVIKKAFLGQAVVILMAVGVTWVTFYFTTKYDIQALYTITGSNTEHIELLRNSQAELKTSMAVITSNPNSLQMQMDGVNQRLNRMEEKQDQMFQLLFDMNKNNP